MLAASVVTGVPRLNSGAECARLHPQVGVDVVFAAIACSTACAVGCVVGCSLHVIKSYSIGWLSKVRHVEA